MKTWIISNGYMGSNYVHVIVTAEPEERAKELASQPFKKGSDSRNKRYEESYWTDLIAQLIGDGECVSEIFE